MGSVVETDDRFDLPFARERVWPILSRTDWINRSLGLPPVEYDITPAPGGGSKVRARAKIFGLEMRWEEQPFQWLENHFYQVDRVFEGGPMERAHLRWEFSAPTADATSIRVFTQLHPRNALGQLICKQVLAKKATRDVAGVIRHVEGYLRGEKQIVLPRLARQPIAEAAFESALAKLRQMNPSAALTDRLTRLIREAPDVQAARIRPLAMARDWKADEWEVLRLFLHATRAGLLSFSWEVLCPNCRSSRQPLTESLANVRREMHCESCQIQYNAELDKSVELRFAVHPSIRACDSSTYCFAGPGAKPHVVAQIHLQAGERRAWAWPGEAALYRVRSPQVRQSKMIEPGEFTGWLHTGGIEVSAERITIRALESGAGAPHSKSDRDFEGSNKGVASILECGAPAPLFGGAPQGQHMQKHSPALAVSNPFAHAMQLVLERVESAEPVLTASQITNWQEFRDLFAREVISPNEQIIVGEQIVLFTDLRGSTAMYCGIGDAPAYALVREHFGILQEAIAANHGSIVKTIGDAVMAVFTRIPEALAAVQQMHEGLAARGESLPLQLKSALHLGSCLAVNANDRLDYFGTTINLAARLVDRSTGGDLAVSDEFFGRPDTQSFLRARGVSAEASSVQFRGFTEAIKVWKIPIVINTQAREKI